jgi:transposase
MLSLGVDVSKGYADGCFLHEAGRVLPGTGRFDDTPDGHAAVLQHLNELAARYLEATGQIGRESTGGLERNWLRLFHQWGKGRVYRLNPLAVKQYLARELHRNGSDPHRARGIAQYLQVGKRPADRSLTTLPNGTLLLYRFVHHSLKRLTPIKNQLQPLLPVVQPDLVRCCRHGLPQWVLRLLEQYPTAPTLAQADPAQLARIPYLTPARAAVLLAAAAHSVAAFGDAPTGTVVATLAGEIRTLQEQIDRLKQPLIALLETDPTGALLRTLPGVGAWTAVCLRLEYGDFRRFHSAAAVVAFAGLDLLEKQSGDRCCRQGISHRGRRQIRAQLYLVVQAALQQEPPLTPFSQRLRDRGKSYDQAVVACRAKLLRWAYAVVTGRPYSPAAAVPAEPTGPAPAAPVPEPAAAGSLAAPVTRREAKRRRTAAAPQAGPARRERGRGTVRRRHDSGTEPACQAAGASLNPLTFLGVSCSGWKDARLRARAGCSSAPGGGAARAVGGARR